MSFRTWIRLTVQWIFSDCDLGKVSACTPSRECVGLHMDMVGCVCVEFRDKILLKGGECETPKNPDFLRKDKMVISSYSGIVGISHFSRHVEECGTLGTL